MSQYVVASEDLLDGGMIYWSNEDGWTDHWADATLFTEEERDSFNLPIGHDSRWVEAEYLTCGECGKEFCVLDASEETAFADHGICFSCAHSR